MLYRNRIFLVRSADGDTSVFDMKVGALQSDTLASFLFITVDYILRSSHENFNM